MKFEIKNQTNTEIELEIEVSSDEFSPFIDKALNNLGKDLEIKGFRKGKAPKNIIEEHFGSEKVLIEAADLAVNETYKKVIVENKIKAIFHPRIEIKKLAKGNNLVYTAKTAIFPQITLPDYKSLVPKIKRKEIEVDEKEIKQTLVWLQKTRAKLTLKNEPAQKGDFIQIEYTLANKPGSDPIKDGFILGEGRLLPGFEDNLVGMKANDEKKGIDLDSNGNKFVVDVKMISVQDMELPEINDEFAKSLGKFSGLDSLKNNIKEGINVEKKQAENQRIRSEILEMIEKEMNIELPDVLIENEQKQMLENLKSQILESLKISFEDYLSKIKKTEEEILKSLRTEAEKKIKGFLILKEIGEKEGIKVADEESIKKILKLLEDLIK